MFSERNVDELIFPNIDKRFSFWPISLSCHMLISIKVVISLLLYLPNIYDHYVAVRHSFWGTRFVKCPEEKWKLHIRWLFGFMHSSVVFWFYTFKRFEIHSIFFLIFVDVSTQDLITNTTTAIGFDERMLLHAEVWFWLSYTPLFAAFKINVMLYN